MGFYGNRVQDREEWRKWPFLSIKRGLLGQMAGQMFSYSLRSPLKRWGNTAGSSKLKKHSEETQHSFTCTRGRNQHSPQTDSRAVGQSLVSAERNMLLFSSMNDLGDTKAQKATSHFYTWNTCLCCDKVISAIVSNNIILWLYKRCLNLWACSMITLMPPVAKTMHKNCRLDFFIKPDGTWSSYRDFRCFA